MKYLFVVGCPRSGTTWLQMLLAQHPDIKTAQETHLFSGYLSALREQWDRHQKDVRGIGLQAVYDSDAFDQLCADIALRTLSEIADDSDQTRCVLEKTPAHVRHADMIARLVPDAYFLHLIRDPRSVADSLTRAGRSWGNHWASENIADNARRWLADVQAGRAIRDISPRYSEIRYEDLTGEHATEEIKRVIGWLGLDRPEGFAKRTIEACRIDKLRNNASDIAARDVIANDPSGFYGAGDPATRKETMTEKDRRIVEHICRDVMMAFG